MTSTTKRVRTTLLTTGAALALLSSVPANSQELGEIVPPLSIAYYASDFGIHYEQSARVLADDWGKLGLDLELRPIQFSTFISTINVAGGLEDIAAAGVGADPDRVDPTYWLFDQSACGQRRNASKWCNESYSEKSALHLTQIDHDERLNTVKELQQQHFDEAPWWPVTHLVFGMVWNSDKWENIQSSSPINPAESQVNPWLNAVPLTDDRILDWGYFEDVDTYNPMAEEGAVGWLRLIYDTFAKIDSEGNTSPWAAESWEFVDDTTLRVKLREGMQFHDGEAVTSDDAVFTLNMAVENQPPAMAARVRNITVAEKVDDLTFDIKLKTSDAAFVTTGLPFLFILPEHHWANYEGDVVARDVIADGVVVGSGPFKFKLWRRNEVHELETHGDHWAAPKYDGIRRLALGQADAIRSALISGQADIATSILPQAAMSDLATQYDYLDFMEDTSHESILVWLNNEKAPFTDQAFRKALRQSTNKQRVVIEAFQGFAIPAGSGPIPKVLSAWHNDDLPSVEFNIEAARQLLEHAGYAWDDSGRLHYPAK